jgi:hypothetical protein
LNTFKVVAGASAVLPIWDHPNFTDEKWHISEVTTHIIFPKSWLDILILLSKWLYPCCTPILVGCIMRIIGYIPTVSTFWCLIPYSSCFWCLVPYSSCFKPHSCWLMPNSCWPIHANSIFSLVKTSFLFLIFAGKNHMFKFQYEVPNSKKHQCPFAAAVEVSKSLLRMLSGC